MKKQDLKIESSLFLNCFFETCHFVFMNQYYIETQHLRNAGVELIFRIGVYIAIALKNPVRSYFQQNTIVIRDKKLIFYITCENKI